MWLEGYGMVGPQGLFVISGIITDIKPHDNQGNELIFGASITFFDFDDLLPLSRLLNKILNDLLTLIELISLKFHRICIDFVDVYLTRTQIERLPQ